MEVLNRCALFSVATRVFAPVREAGGRTKDGAIIKSERIEIIDPRVLNPLNALKGNLFLACRQYGTKLDIMNAWVVPQDRADLLEQKIKGVLSLWDERKSKIVSEFHDFVEAQAAANPTQAHAIRSMAPSPSEVAHAIRAAYVRFTLKPDEVLTMGLENELNSLPAQAAQEIAQDIRESLTDGSKYTRKTLEVLRRVAVKAGSFGFLSPALEAVPSAVEKLIKGLPQGQSSFKGEESLTIGAMIAFLSNPQRLIEEGRKIDKIIFVPQEKPVAAPPPLAVASPIAVPVEAQQEAVTVTQELEAFW